MARSSEWLPALEASRMLGVRPASLYAYVSRGMIRAAPHPETPRSRLYLSADIEALIERKRRQARPRAAAATALDWGLPVLATRISTIADGRLHYRDHEAIELAETATAEDIAALLWQQTLPAFLGVEEPVPPVAGSPIDRAVAMLAADLPGSLAGERGERLHRRAERLVGRVAAAAAGRPLAGPSLHLALARAWKAPEAADAIRRALVLVADHELNASTFAVRVTASTGASLTHSVISGLVTLAGPIHGGATQRVAAMLDETDRIGDPTAAVAGRQSRGEPIPGFGHRLYPTGDPRARALLAVLPLSSRHRGFLEAGEAATGEKPTIDVALVLLERTYALPRDTALSLFAIGRSIGWIAHAMEQAQTGQLIRPRAAAV